MNKIKSINNSINQLIHIYHKPRYQSSTEFYQYSTYSLTMLLKFTYLKDNSVQFESNQKIFFCKVITNNFWFPIETNNKQTFFLMYEQYPRTRDVHLTSTPYLSSWLRWLKITEQYNYKLFIDFNKYLMVLGSNRYPTHRQLSL